MIKHKVLTINPGSTSTKIALFENDRCLYTDNIKHATSELLVFKDLNDQLPYRRNKILKSILREGVSLENLDACVGRGGGLVAMRGGTYRISQLMLKDAKNCANGVVHPATLGPQLAAEFADKYHAQAMVVNPPDVDELQDLARMTGIKGVYRSVHLHALNLKETAIRHCKEVLMADYNQVNLIVCHLGGGISISAHREGRMIDGFDIVGGEGPMAPTRCGSISVVNLLSYIEKNQQNISKTARLTTRTGGFVDHLGTADAKEIFQRGKSGDRYAMMLWNTMIYQVEKCIGEMAAVLKGKVSGILLSGGMVHNQDLVQKISDDCSFIAPVTAYPGEFEMQAMSAGAIRVLMGEENLKEYTGVPNWKGFEWEK